MSTFHYLSEDLIAEVHATAVKLRLASELDRLQAGILPEFAATLPAGGEPSARLFATLQILNKTKKLRDGSVPLAAFLTTAGALRSSNTESCVFDRALGQMRRHHQCTPVASAAQRTIVPWQDLEHFVADVLSLAGFTLQPAIGIDSQQTACWRTSSGSPVAIRIVVECRAERNPDIALPAATITDFCERVQLARVSGLADFGWLITNQVLPSETPSIIRQARMESACSALSTTEFLYKLLDIPAYVAQLRVGSSLPATGFVEPSVEILTGIGRYPAKSSFSALLDLWLQDRGRPLLLLLGDFGQGKTTCCEEMVRRYGHNMDALHGRIPLSIKLREVANQGYALRAILRVCLQEQYGLSYRSLEFLEYLAKRGLFVFVFDGLDEITHSLRWSEVFAAFKQIARLLQKGNKVIITSRPGVFPQRTSIIQALEKLVQLSPALPNPSYLRSNYVVAYLQYFEQDQIQEAMRNYGVENPSRVMALMARIHDLTDLSRRPITLKMILESLEQIEAGAIGSHADLYGTYTARWLARDAWRSTIESLSMEEGQDLKRVFLEALAWELHQKESTNIEIGFIERVVLACFPDNRPVADLAQAFAKEVAICSFLDTRRDGSLAFSHKSFYEYFLARYLASREALALLELLSSHSLSNEVLDFLRQLVKVEPLIERHLSSSDLISKPILALNVVYLLSFAGAPIFLNVRLPPGARLQCKLRSPCALRITASENIIVELESECSIRVEFEDCKVMLSRVASTGAVNVQVEGAEVQNLEVSAAGRLTLMISQSRVLGGLASWGEGGELRVQNDCILSGFVVESTENLKIESDGEEVPPRNAPQFLRDRGVRTLGDLKSKPERDARMRRSPRIHLQDPNDADEFEVDAEQEQPAATDETSGEGD